MHIKILLFGTLSDIAGASRVEINSFVKDTEELKNYLNKKYPSFGKANYLISVNQSIVRDKTMLNDGDEVALLPPFAGG